MKLVLDTNVVFAAFATEGICHALFELCIDQHQVFVSRELLEELSDKLHNKLKMPLSAVKEITGFLKDVSSYQRPKPLSKRVCRDPDDDAILALAAHVEADYLITGDQDLIVLERYESTLIVTPRKFWEISRQPKT